MKKNLFESKIQPLLQYIGVIGAVLTSIVYVIIIVVLIQGFTKTLVPQTLLFASINAIMGFIIMQLLKVQGIQWAQELPENKPISDQYFATKTKDKKIRSLRFFWLKSVVKDIVFKCCTVAAMTGGILYIVITGSGEYMLLLLALANLILFTCFGLLALNSAYRFYNQFQVPYMQEQLKKSKEVNDVKDRRQNISKS